MKVPSKGNTIEIAPGVRFVEHNHSKPEPLFYLQALTDPEVGEDVIFGMKCPQYRWKARDLVTGAERNYLVTGGRLIHYAPMLFQTFEDSEEFWRRPFGKKEAEG